MSEADVTVKIALASAEFNAAMWRVSEAIGMTLRPAIESFADSLRQWLQTWQTWPGMPYTAPSLWEAEQVAADFR